MNSVLRLPNQAAFNFGEMARFSAMLPIGLIVAGDDNHERVRARRKHLAHPAIREQRRAKREGRLTAEIQAAASAVWNSAPGYAVQEIVGAVDNASVQSWIAEKQAQGCGIFFATQETSGKRGIKNLKRIRCVFAEFDQPATKPLPLPPSITVESSPGKFHHYWLLNAGENMPLELFDGIMTNMPGYGADGDALDAARILRIPGTWHLKGSPFMCRIADAGGRSYSVAELATAFPPVAKPPRQPRTAGDLADAFELRKAAEAIAMVDLSTEGAWWRVGAALHDATEGSAEGLQVWIDASWPEAEAHCEDRWSKFSGDGITLGSIYHEARQAGWPSPSADACFGGPFTGTLPPGASLTPLPPAPAPSVGVIDEAPWAARWTGDMPKRPRLFGKHYMRWETGVTAAPGATGKTALATVEILSMVTGRRLLYDMPEKPLRVAYFGEDRLEEIELRFAAAMEHYCIGSDDIGDRLRLHSLRDTPLTLIVKGGAVNDADMAKFRMFLMNTATDIVFLDTLTNIHSAEENDTKAMAALVFELNRLASKDVANCAIEILTHTRKPSNGAAVESVSEIRGPGSLINAVRSARLLARVDGDWEHIHFVDAKTNSVRPIDKEQRFRLTSFNAANGESVQVVTTSGGAAEGCKIELTEAQLTTIFNEMALGKNRQKPYGQLSWIGDAIATALNLKIDKEIVDPKERKQNLKTVANIVEYLLAQKIIEPAKLWRNGNDYAGYQRVFENNVE